MSVNASLEIANELMNNKEVLTKEERDVCVQFMPEMATEYLFQNPWNNTWLNLNVYSEIEKEESDLRKELGF
jgi:hypothetical protein